MVSTEKISRKFVQLEEYLELLARIGEISEKEFIDDIRMFRQTIIRRFL